MKKIDQRYYEPLEQMMAIRHNYMAKIIQNEDFDRELEKIAKDMLCGYVSERKQRIFHASVSMHQYL